MAASLATLASRLAKLLLQPLSFDEHVIGVSIAFLPLLPQPPEAGPIILLTAVHGFDQFEVDASPRLFNHHLEFAEEFGAKEGHLLKASQVGQDLLKSL